MYKDTIDMLYSVNTPDCDLCALTNTNTSRIMAERNVVFNDALNTLLFTVKWCHPTVKDLEIISEENAKAVVR